MTGRRPELSTGGGTSDARFIKNACPVVELGLVNATIHAVDERVPLDDLEALSLIYERALDRYFAEFAGYVDSPGRVPLPHSAGASYPPPRSGGGGPREARWWGRNNASAAGNSR